MAEAMTRPGSFRVMSGCLLLAGALLLFGGCASKPKSRPLGESSPINLAVIRDALSLQGIPYRWGEETPENGFDCSGFVQYVYGQQGVRLPRTAREMADALPPLPEFHRRPGDLVFFNTTGEPYSHVGIYIGGSDFVHASSAKGTVVVSSLETPYWTDHFLGLRRPGGAAVRFDEPETLQIGRWYR